MMIVSNQSKNLPKVGAEVSQMGYGAIEGKGRIIESPFLSHVVVERLADRVNESKMLLLVGGHVLCCSVRENVSC